MKVPTIETERLILKRGTYEDYLKVYEYDFTRLRNVAGEFEFVKSNPKTIEGFAKEADENDNIIDFIIFLKETNEPIGNLVYENYEEFNKSLEITCNLHPNYWEKGYMTEAILYSMNYIFNNEDIENIRYGYAEENKNSKALNERIGFIYQNTKIEHYNRIDKDIKEIQTIISKKQFYELYKDNFDFKKRNK